MTLYVDPFDPYQEVIDYQWTPPQHDTTVDDEETLRRSRRTLVATSTVVRRTADHPVEPWADSHVSDAEADRAWGVAS